MLNNSNSEILLSLVSERGQSYSNSNYLRKMSSQNGHKLSKVAKINVILSVITAITQEIWKNLSCIPRKSDKKKHLGSAL